MSDPASIAAASIAAAAAAAATKRRLSPSNRSYYNDDDDEGSSSSSSCLLGINKNQYKRMKMTTHPSTDDESFVVHRTSWDGNEVSTKSRRRTVRFDHKVSVHKKIIYTEENDETFPSTKTTTNETTTWLTLNDYERIQRYVFTILDCIHQYQEVIDSSLFYSRGLEDFCTVQKGNVKQHVLARRKEAIHSVLHEQQQCRRRRQQQQQQKQKEEQKMILLQEEERRTDMATPRSDCDATDDATTMIRFVYEMHTSHSTNTAIARGAYDSEQALAVYAEQQQRQQQQQQIIHRHDNEENINRSISTTTNIVTPPMPPKTIIGVADFESSSERKRKERMMRPYMYR